MRMEFADVPNESEKMFLEIDVSEIEDRIERCENTDDFKKEIIPLLKSEQEEWIIKINKIIFDSGLSKTRFAEACGVSRGALNKWCKGSIPKKTDTFLKIAKIARYSSDETKDLLQKYGKCPRLESENNDFNEFYTSIITFIRVNFEKENITVSKLADSQGWSSSLRQCVSAIRQKKWCPVRNKVISLGMHLGMRREQIDTILKLAYMEPLSPANIFEATVMFILESSELNFANIDMKNCNGDFMIEYAVEVIKQLDDPGVTNFLSEFQGKDEG